MLPRWHSSPGSRLLVPAGWAARWLWNLDVRDIGSMRLSRETAASSRRKARVLAKKVHATAAMDDPRLDADLVWLCVPDREIAKAARHLAQTTDWKGKTAFHSSGALASDELGVLRRRGAAVASVHPLMTFVRGSVPSLQWYSCRVRGRSEGLRVARRDSPRVGRRAISHFRTGKWPITPGEDSPLPC